MIVDGPPDRQGPRPPDPAATGLRWRPLTAADVPAWHELVRAVEDADAIVERHSEGDLGDLLERPGADPARLSLVGVDPEGRFAAVGVVAPDHEPVGQVRVHLHGGVHPAHRRRGVGTALLAWQVAAARAHLARARHGLPARLGLDVEGGHDDRTALARAAGLQPTRWFRNLHRPLDDVRAGRLAVPATGAGLRIVRWTPDLDEPVRRAHNEAFRDHWGSQPRSPATWRRDVGEHRDTRRDWSFVVLDESGEHRESDDGPVVAGYAVSSAHPDDWPALGGPEGYTALLGVRRPWRRRGLAPALLVTSLHAFAAGGMRGAGLDVDAANPSGAAELYDRLGYRTRRTSVLHALALPPG